MGVILLKGLISINRFIKHHLLVHIKTKMHVKISVFHTDLLLFSKLIDVSLFSSLLPLLSLRFCLPRVCVCRHPCSGLWEALGDYCSLEAAALMWGSCWRCLADSGGGRLITKPYRLISNDVQQGGEHC